MEKNTLKIYNGKVFGIKVSDYGLENGYLDYYTLAKIVGNRILNNNLISETYPEDWELVNGDYEDDIFQFYIISDYGYEILGGYTDEMVIYNEKLDIYLWCINHFGTSWDYILTDIKLVEEMI